MRNACLFAVILLIVIGCSTPPPTASRTKPEPKPAPPEARTSRHRETVKAADGLVPFPARGDRRIKIDGDLSDWGDLRADGLVIHQVLHHMRGTGRVLPTENDAALVKLMRDPEAIYVGVRVADDQIIAHLPIKQAFRADCVELFFDVRPLTGPGKLLGDRKYSVGCYQLFAVPPTPKGKPFRWAHAGTKVGKLGPIEAAGRAIRGGYEIELRLPLKSLDPEAAPERLSQPIGFQMMVDDLDRASFRKNGTQRTYRHGNRSGYHVNAAALACADPAFARNPKLPYLSLEAPALRRVEGKLRLTMRAVTTDAITEIPGFNMAWRHAATAFDQPQPADAASFGKVPLKPAWEPVNVPRRVSKPLGVAFHSRQIRPQETAPGRYYVTYKMPGKPKGETHYYGAYFNDEVILRRTSARVAEPVDVGAMLINGHPWLLLDSPFYYGQHTFGGRLTVYTDYRIYFDLSETAAQGGDLPAYGLHLVVRDSAGKAVKTLPLPLRPSGARFELDAKDLELGSYLLEPAVITPDGQTHVLKARGRGGKRTKMQMPLQILKPRDVVLKTTVVDAEEIRRKPIKIGDPARAQFPKDNVSDCQARSVHDLQLFNGRIYVGVGDWNNNRGPIDILSFVPPATGQRAGFIKEFSVDDESVDIFRVSNGKLLVPGTDSADKVPNQWELGNLYIKSEGKWTKRRTVPNGIHVFDATYFDGKLYVTTGTQKGAAMFESADDGKTWIRCAHSADAGRFYEMQVVGNSLVTWPGNADQVGFQLHAGRQKELRIPFLPGETARRNTVERSTAFLQGIVYTTKGWRTPIGPKPMFYLHDLEQGASVIQAFLKRNVQDILVREGICYVLTREVKDKRFYGRIFKSEDLKAWTKVAEFEVPGAPRSFELANGSFYVGLANLKPWRSADKASGSIWRLE